jgi:hypothetical protein
MSLTAPGTKYVIILSTILLIANNTIAYCKSTLLLIASQHYCLLLTTLLLIAKNTIAYCKSTLLLIASQHYCLLLRYFGTRKAFEVAYSKRCQDKLTAYVATLEEIVCSELQRDMQHFLKERNLCEFVYCFFLFMFDMILL